MVNDDKELDDYLEGNSDLSNQYHASDLAEPSPRLNEKILSAAKVAAVAKQKPKVLFHKSPWVRPISIAAMITLSVSLVVTMQQETGKPLISVPESNIEPYNSTVLSEDMVMPETVTADDDLFVQDEVELRQRIDKRVDAPTAMGAVGDYRAETKENMMKDEAITIKPAKRALLKQKSLSIESKKGEFVKEQLLQSAPMEEELDADMEFKSDRQINLEESLLLKIKSMWKTGKIAEAKEAYQEFQKAHPHFSLGKTKEILGPDLYQALNL